MESRMVARKEELCAVAESLIKAEITRTPIMPITKTIENLTIEDAYEIQIDVVRRKRAKGEKIVGKKIGLTSKAIQQVFNVYEPDYGHIMSNLMVIEGEAVKLDELIQPRVEGEIAFILNRPLKGPGVTISDVVRATEGLMPAIEVIDSRIMDWNITARDSIADNASIGRVILGGKITTLRNLDLRYVGMVMEKNGEIVSTAAGSAVLGNPLQSVAWLANKLSEYESCLEVGEIIMSGSLIAPCEARPTDNFKATFDHLGSVGVRFS